MKSVVKSERELDFPLRLDYGRSPHVYVNQRLQIQLELLMMSDMPLETCGAFNKLWNNMYYYKVASCWLFLLSHTTMHGSMNINFLNAELNPICHLLALLGVHFLHVSRIRVKSLTLRLLVSYIYIYIYIYMEHLFLMFLDHTERRTSVGRTPLDE